MTGAASSRRVRTARLLTRAAAAATALAETIPIRDTAYRSKVADSRHAPTPPAVRSHIGVSEVNDTGRGVVERYLDAIVSHDWEAMAACVAEDVERVGPFCDVYRGRKDYVAFIADLLPSLGGYAMKVDRVVYAGPVAVAELTESVEGTDTPEALVFDLDADGRIAHISIYIQRPEFEAALKE
jgi:hypothetical protein